MKLLPLCYFNDNPRYVYGNRGYGDGMYNSKDIGLNIRQHDMSKINYPMDDGSKYKYLKPELTYLQ